jgi:rhamnulose-1-phosphate aldolase
VGTSSRPEDLDELLAAFSEAGQLLHDLHSVEAGAGNISACFDWDTDLTGTFGASRELDLPISVPALAGRTVMVTGSGCRLRQLAGNPVEQLGAIVVHRGGTSGTLHVDKDGNFARPTVEFSTHLAVHAEQVEAGVTGLHAIVHAQPPHLTLLSHIPAYQDTDALNRAILRWEAETIVALPAGVGYVPAHVPGAEELTRDTVVGLRKHQLVLWAKHGVMSRAAGSVLKACDLIEYAETGAMFEYMNLCSGGHGEGLSEYELRRVVRAFHLDTPLFP